MHKNKRREKKTQQVENKISLQEEKFHNNQKNMLTKPLFSAKKNYDCHISHSAYNSSLFYLCRGLKKRREKESSVEE